MTKIACPALCPFFLFVSIAYISSTSLGSVEAFVTTPSSTSINLDSSQSTTVRRSTTRRTLSRTHKYYSTLQDTNEDVVLYSDEDYDDDDDASVGGGGGTAFEQNPRWRNLSPSLKKRIIEEAEEKAVRNKKKREPSAEKKRRMWMFYKKLARKSKRASQTKRPLSTDSPDRTLLSELQPGQPLNGTVISLTNFGAYVDVGSECDGLLHVSQITREQFVEHPRQVLSPGDEVDVWLVKCSSELNKMQLTMLPSTLGLETKAAQQYNNDDDDDDEEERIQLEDLAANDELWGKITRVTSYGAYVELGAEAKGWLHFMDHPEFTMGMVPA